MEIEIRKGTAEDIDPFVQLLQDVRAGMDHKEWFYLDPPDTIWNMMHQGMMKLWVATHENRIVAAFNLLRPGMESCNYGYALGFSDDALQQVINMDTVAVHPDYRGRGLHRALLNAAEQEIKITAPHILLCTVHPENRFSLNNVLKMGYTVQKETAMYGSVRYILRKDIF